MPITSAKNASLGPAAQDLGLGDALQAQAEALIEERKKKALGMPDKQMAGLGNALQGPASAALGLGGLNG